MAKAAVRAGRRRNEAELPATFHAQLATLVSSPPAGDDWLHELKLDGYRIGCRIEGNQARLISRNGKDWTDRFPEVERAAAELPVRKAFLDGEVAVLLPDGRTSFQALQNVMSAKPPRNLVYFVFDLLHLDGENIASQPLEERKRRLEDLLGSSKTGVLRFTDHVVGRGPEFLERVAALGLEGIVSKRRNRAYAPGRGKDWLKAKCIRRQEFVIGGFTDPEGSRAGIGALLVGVHENGRLLFTGKVGTGFTQQSARDLRRILDEREQKECPFAVRPPGWLGRHAHWVRPDLVAEVAFTEWTEEGKIRHPSFQDLRADKEPREVVREDPAAAATAPARPARRARAGRASVAGVQLSNPDRVLYPEIGLTKLGLAQFYEHIADWILPHVTGRPLTLVRCPRGLGESCFYMKHSRVWAPEGLKRVRIPEKTKVGEYLVVESLQGLIALVQMDILEIHTWNSTVQNLECPNRIVLDLDPGPEVEWTMIREGARLLRTTLASVGLESFVKTTGGVGLHVVIPLLPESGWKDCLAFARLVASTLSRHHPERYTTSFAKRGRERKILIDYLRNNRTNTSVAAYSTRARPRAPVSVPLAWDELDRGMRSDRYTVENLGKRLAGLKEDPWSQYWHLRQRLPSMKTTEKQIGL